MTQQHEELEWIDEVILGVAHEAGLIPHGKTYGAHFFEAQRQSIAQKIREEVEKGIVAYRDRVSTDNRPLDAPPLIAEQPAPCPRCKKTKYADWYLYPHQVYNSYMPGGTGHYCFDCFCAVVVEAQLQGGGE